LGLTGKDGSARRQKQKSGLHMKARFL